MTNIDKLTDVVRADRATIQDVLRDIQSDWERGNAPFTYLSPDALVVDTHGDLHPAAEAELLRQLPMVEGAYTLYDADTAEPIGPATSEQVIESLVAYPEGIILIDGDGTVLAEGQQHDSWRPQPIRRVYIEA